MNFWTSLARRNANILLAHAQDAGLDLAQVQVHPNGTISWDGYTFAWNIQDQCVEATETPLYVVRHVA